MNARRRWVSIVVALCAGCSSGALAATTQAALPDERVYELVTPQEDYGSEVYQPLLSESFVAYSGTKTELHFQAAADGNRIAFLGGPTVGGSESIGFNKGNEYLGTRSPDSAWKQTNLSPEVPGLSLSTTQATSMLYKDFSSNLTVGFLESSVPLSSTAPGYGEPLPEFNGLYNVLYSTNTDGAAYTPLFTVQPPHRSHEQFRVAFAGSSSDLTHTVFAANDALTGALEGRPAAEGGAGPTFVKEDNLYENVNGQLRLVNVLPGGTTHAGAEFGGGTNLNRILSDVMSQDGLRIFWTDLTTGHIYVRENGTSTVEISSAGKYQTASSDGSVVFYTNGDLYEYELAGAQTTDLTPGVPIEKVIGASEDGKYVYYVTVSHDVKLWHEGATTTITHSSVSSGEVAPSGRSVVFTETETSGPVNIYVFSADTGTMYCLGCAVGGTRGALPDTSHSATYQTRWVSADGSRVFFDSLAALVPQDANGRLDVYEWERPGTGSCAETEGCIYLLSEGTSTDHSYLADASVSGSDVFIITRAKLVGADEGGTFDMYDLRVGGGLPPSPPACTGTGCQGVPNAPPIFATPSSVTFEGVGNFAASTKEAKAKPKPRKKPKHKKKKTKAKKSARKANGHRRSSSKGGRS